MKEEKYEAVILHKYLLILTKKKPKKLWLNNVVICHKAVSSNSDFDSYSRKAMLKLATVFIPISCVA